MATIRNRVSIYSHLLSNCSNDRFGFIYIEIIIYIENRGIAVRCDFCDRDFCDFCDFFAVQLSTISTSPEASLRLDAADGLLF